ncbi:MAG: hypothetical protein Q9180_004321 [Flavoplaca navasiana]
MASDAATQGHKDLEDFDPIVGFPLNSSRDSISRSARRAQVIMRPVTLDDLDLSSESEASPVSSPTPATVTMTSHPRLAAQNVDPNNVSADSPASPRTSAKATKTSHSRFASRTVVSVTARTCLDMKSTNDSQDPDSVPADHINDSRNDGSASPIRRRVGYGGYHPLWRPLPYGGVVPRPQHDIQDDASSLGSTARTDTQEPGHQTSADENAEFPARYNGPARGSVLRDNIKKQARPGAMESLQSWPLEKTLKANQDSQSMPKQDIDCIDRQAIQYNQRGKVSKSERRVPTRLANPTDEAQSQKNPSRKIRPSSTAPSKRSAHEIDDLFHAAEEQRPRRSKRKLERDAQKASGRRADALLSLRNKRAARTTHPITESSITGTKVAKPAPAWDSAALRTIGNFRDGDGQNWVYVEEAWWP